MSANAGASRSRWETCSFGGWHWPEHAERGIVVGDSRSVAGRSRRRACTPRRRPPRPRRTRARSRGARRGCAASRRRGRSPPTGRRSASHDAGPRATSWIWPARTRTSLPAPRTYGEVQAADDPARRARVVVLDHLLLDAQGHQVAAAVGLHEEAAVIAEGLGLKQQRAVQPSLDYVEGHGRQPSGERSTPARPT